MYHLLIYEAITIWQSYKYLAKESLAQVIADSPFILMYPQISNLQELQVSRGGALVLRQQSWNASKKLLRDTYK